MPKQPQRPVGEDTVSAAHDPKLTALIGQEVIRRLGEPDQLRLVQVRPVWGDHYRVNVFVGPDLASARAAHCYFIAAEPDGSIRASDPEIRRLYPGPVEASPAAPERGLS